MCSCPDPEGEPEGSDPPGKLQVAEGFFIGILGTDPLKKQLDPLCKKS